MRLSAEVRRVTGATVHHVTDGRGSMEQLEPAARVEIVDADGGVLLVRYGRGGFAGDTWHATVDEAKRQAEVEFAISPLSWEEKGGDS